MTSARLDDLLAMKRTAIVLRNSGRHKDALQMLEKVAKELQLMAASMAAGENAGVEIRAELADTYGMEGGVLRRLGDLKGALHAYEAGKAEEEKDNSSTYNLGNVIVLKIQLGEASRRDDDMQRDIKTTIDRLKRQITGARSDEWWAWADLGQFYLLQGNFGEADQAYEQGRRTGPTVAEYRRHLDVLRELCRDLAPREPVFTSRLSEFVNKLQTQYE
jgi:tetratricopeptide (TPR) repeat protein